MSRYQIEDLLDKFRQARAQELAQETQTHGWYIRLSTEQIVHKMLQMNADGIWHCGNCSHENALLKLNCPHPFGYLRCGKCDKIWDPSHVTSGVLHPLPGSPRESRRNSGYVCNTCGLSHFIDPQLVPYKSCVCGAECSERWPRFRVGSGSDYRDGDPNATFVPALERKIQQSMTYRTDMEPRVHRAETYRTDVKPRVHRVEPYRRAMEPRIPLAEPRHVGIKPTKDEVQTSHTDVQIKTDNTVRPVNPYDARRRQRRVEREQRKAERNTFTINVLVESGLRGPGPP
ncbi:hypothetical protein P154DRAFT_540712 [Amniculicola lignicola CBS 123094]|uniref:Probable double zinc ribbon domain-containing protein n=1 Tax=Amniculicola lignicola CBS 123094 TaxID=1392246 RepID=A0A6A5VYX3_9PLEO|nr:hypothetical protein P154DRAFT_540712 [Amniculicola lignicola CBS 123094]